MLYWFIWFISNSFHWLLFPFQVFGLEHIPHRGGFMIASNHCSYADPYLLGVASPRQIYFVARDTLFHNPILAFVLRELGTIPIRREYADKAALTRVISGLKAGHPFLIFPEGTRHIRFDGTNAQPGIGLIAVKSGLPVVPVYIEGTDDLLPAGARWVRRALVTIRFGEPIVFGDRKDYQSIANEIMTRVYDLAP